MSYKFYFWVMLAVIDIPLIFTIIKRKGLRGVAISKYAVRFSVVLVISVHLALLVEAILFLVK